jgi:predicted nuclease of predicted toxin-antitoxin system
VALRFKLDENLPERAVLSLQSQGHDVETAVSEGLAGAADPKILAASISEQRILVTLDLDFADIRKYPVGSHCGMWILRPSRQTFSAIVALVEAGLRLTAVEQTIGQLWIIDERRVRIRD